MSGRNALAVLPTGGGKSLCYQIPSLLRSGLGIVVSPLIALMTDQVSALRQAGVAAARLDSAVDPDEREAVWRRVNAGELDLLYLSPEGLMQGAMLERLRACPIALVAIDEAHCVSQWGHDFRPEYRMLGRLAEMFPNAPRLAVTATADARTREDIARELRLEDAAHFVDSFARPELALFAERKTGRSSGRVLELVAERRGRSGIVYTGSRDGTETLAASLVQAGIPAMAYHAGLDKGLRGERLRRFLAEDEAVMVATIAFGMGIDKPDVRYVIHADAPASIEAYWQEVGRAGRDGAPAEGVTLYSSADMAFASRRIDGRAVDNAVKQVQGRKLRQLYAMLDGVGCRATAVRLYFGETDVDSCGQCDLCLSPPARRDVTTAAQKVLSAAQRLGGRYGRGRLIDHLLGKTKDVSPLEAGLTTYGIGQDLSLQAWRDLTDQLLFDGLLREDPNDGRPLVGLGDEAAVRLVYRGETRVHVRERATAPAKAAKSRTGLEVSPADRGLFEALRAWRKSQALVQGVPPYVIFGDRTLVAIAAARPMNRRALEGLTGVGQVKLERYGADVLDIVKGGQSAAAE